MYPAGNVYQQRRWSHSTDFGLTGVWAEENTRASIFAALKRRETYATSGTRPTLRFFAGALDVDLCESPDMIRKAYEQGAPMGLSKDWAYQVISQVGNYSELFERNLGEGSNLKLERGINALWNKGGLMYGVPLR